jgi:2'-5' RNA ligase
VAIRHGMTANKFVYASEADIVKWSKLWQRDYRFGLLLIFPPDPPKSQVDALRAKYDPVSQSVIGAHITLTVCFSEELTGSTELEFFASRIDPFTIYYGPLVNYLPAPGVCLGIQPQQKLAELVKSLESASVFTGAKPRPYPFSAHMTIAENITAEQTNSLMVELKDKVPVGDFLCDHVSYAVPDARFHFTERARLKLGR